MVHLATEQVLARTLKPGDVVSFKEGNRTVKSVRFGDPRELGFISLGGHTASPWVVEFDCGARAEVHPRHIITRLLPNP